MALFFARILTSMKTIKNIRKVYGIYSNALINDLYDDLFVNFLG